MLLGGRASLTSANTYDRATEAEIYSLCLTGAELQSCLAGGKIASPLMRGRNMDNAGFGLFIGNEGQIRWKDFYTGYGGDAIYLYSLLFEVSRHKAMSMIDEGLGLQLNGSVAKGIERKTVILPPNLLLQKPDADIAIQHKSWDDKSDCFWGRWGLERETRDKFNTFNVGKFSINGYLCNPTTDCYAYKIADRYKIYQPYDKEFKWRNNFRPSFVEGLWQIKGSRRKKLLIITKATKECMYYDQHLATDAISAKSESEIVPLELLDILIPKYDRVIAILDNDRAGIAASHRYESLGIEAKLFKDAKNITDLHEMIGLDKAKEAFNDMLDTH